MKNLSLFDKISYFSFLVTILTLPFFFLPTFQFSLAVSKGILLYGGILISLSFWLIARIIDGKVSFPKSNVLIGLAVLVGVYFLTALFSPVKSLSFWGQGFEIDTFFSVIIFSLATFLGMTFFSSTGAQIQKRFLNFQTLLVGSFSLMTIFWILDLVFRFSNDSFFGSIGGNLFGSLNDLGIFAGLVSILSLTALETLPLSRTIKFILWLVLLLSLFAIAAVGFQAVWVAIGVFAVVFFIYKMTFGAGLPLVRAGGAQASKPFMSLSVALAAVFFILINSGFVGNYLGIKNTDIRPAVSSTVEVVKASLKTDPLLGAGPNRFSFVWTLYKPALINQTQFWNIDFSFGFSLIPSFVATSGILGGLSWLLLFILILISVIRAIQTNLSSKNALLSHILLSCAAAALYLWVFNFVYVAGFVLVALSFVFTGLLVGALANAKNVKTLSFSFLKDPRLSFFSILLIVMVLIAVGFLGYKAFKKFSSIIVFERAYTSAKSLDAAEEGIIRAASLDRSDLYFRSLSEVYLLKMKDLLSGQAVSADSQKALQDNLTKAEQSAKLALDFDQLNYKNWLNLGLLYENVLALKVEGAYGGALAAYTEALKLNPNNPGIQQKIESLKNLNTVTNAEENNPANQ